MTFDPHQITPIRKTNAQIDADMAEEVRAANEALESMRDQSGRLWYYSVSHCSFEMVVGDEQGKGNLVFLLTGCDFISGPVMWPRQQLEVIWKCDRERQNEPWEFVLQDASVGFRVVAATFGWRRDYDLVRYGSMYTPRDDAADEAEAELGAPANGGVIGGYDLAQALWRGATCLAIDSIQFGDGTVAILAEGEPLGLRATKLIVIRKCTWLAVISERLGNSLHSATLSWVCRMNEIETAFDGQSLRIECGEVGGNGSFGYVAVETKSESMSNELWWVAFFSGSNPFESLAVEDGVLHALSTCGYRYSFQLSDPTNVSVQKREDLTWWGQDEEN